MRYKARQYFGIRGLLSLLVDIPSNAITACLMAVFVHHSRIDDRTTQGLEHISQAGVGETICLVSAQDSVNKVNFT